MASLNYTLDGMNMFYEGFFLGFADDEEHTVTYSPFGDDVVIKTREAMFSGSFNGNISIEGENYFACIRKVGDRFIGTAIPSKTLFSLRDNIATATVLFSLVAFLLLLSFMLYGNSDEDDAIKARLDEQELALNQEGLAEGAANFDVIMPSGEKKRVKAASARWNKTIRKWKQMSVEQKFSLIVGVFLLVFGGFVFLALLATQSVSKSNSIIQYILKGDLERSANIYVLTRCCIYIAMLLVGDSLTSDMKGGLLAGIPTCWYTPKGHPRPADHEIQDLRRVFEVI